MPTDAPSAEPHSSSDTGSARFWVGLALLGVVLSAVAWWHGPGFFTIDEQAYRHQVEVVSTTGQWATPDAPGRIVSPEFTPLANGERADDGWLAYAKHPLYVRVLLAADGVAGSVGLAAVSILGAVASIGLLADLAGRRGAVAERTVALGVAAAATPIVVHAWILWAHTLTIAAVAVSVWALHRSRTSIAWLPLAAAGTAIAPMLRSEATLVVPGLVTLALVEPNRRLGRLGTAFVVGAAGVIGFVADRLWAAAVVDALGTPGRSSAGDPFTDIVLGVWHAWFSPGAADLVGLARLLGAIAFIAAGVVSVRRHQATRYFAAAGVVATLVGVASDVPVQGLLPAAPIVAVGGGVLAGFLLDQRHIPVDAPSRRSLLPLAVVAGLLVVLLPASGGGLGWGGRYVLVLLPFTVPVAEHARSRLRPSVARELLVAVTAAGLVLTASGAWMIDQRHATAERLGPEIAADLAAVGPLLDDATASVAITEDLRLGRWAPRSAADLGLWTVDRDELWPAAEAEALRLDVCRVLVVELGVDAPGWPAARWERGAPIEVGRLTVVPWERRDCAR